MIGVLLLLILTVLSPVVGIAVALGVVLFNVFIGAISVVLAAIYGIITFIVGKLSK